MAIETLEDIIDRLADWIGVYGAHDTDEPRPGFSPELHCRVCFVSAMRERIVSAVNIEQTLAGHAVPSTQFSPAVCKAMSIFWNGLANRASQDTSGAANADS